MACSLCSCWYIPLLMQFHFIQQFAVLWGLFVPHLQNLLAFDFILEFIPSSQSLSKILLQIKKFSVQSQKS